MNTTLTPAQIAEYITSYDAQIAEELATPVEAAPEYPWMVSQTAAAKLGRIAELNKSRSTLMAELVSKIAR